jgi:hypothetical protein
MTPRPSAKYEQRTIARTQTACGASVQREFETGEDEWHQRATRLGILLVVRDPAILLQLRHCWELEST